MYVKLSDTSIANLMTCHHELIALFVAATKDSPIDFSIIQGHRGKEEQNSYFNATPKKSKLEYPNSKHNKTPSLAVDVIPYPVDWDDIDRFEMLRGHIEDTAKLIGVKIRGVIIFSDGRHDHPHYELIK